MAVLRTLLILAALVGARAAYACSCVPMPLEDDIYPSTVIVEGTVVWAGPRKEGRLDGEQRVRLRVAEVFHGPGVPKGAELEFTYLHCSTFDIDPQFEEPRIWFVQEDGGERFTMLCNARAPADDDGRARVREAVRRADARDAALAKLDGPLTPEKVLGALAGGAARGLAEQALDLVRPLTFLPESARAGMVEAIANPSAPLDADGDVSMLRAACDAALGRTGACARVPVDVATLWPTCAAEPAP